MSLRVHLGPVHIDLDALEELAGRLDGVSHEMHDLHPLRHANVDAVGHPAVAAAIDQFVDVVAPEHTDQTEQLARLSDAARKAAEGYRRVDESVAAALAGGDA